MQVVEKKHHINFTMYGKGLSLIKKILKENYPNIEFNENDDEELIDSKDSLLFSDITKSMNAGDVLLIRRENKKLTQKQLSELTGIAIPNISQMENGTRKIGKVNAKKLATALDCEASDFFMYL